MSRNRRRQGAAGRPPSAANGRLARRRAIFWAAAVALGATGVVLCVLWGLPPRPRARPNVLLVSVDTLRADRLGVYGGGELTPGLDALARAGVVFDRALTHAPLTLPAHASLLTGLYPTAHGIHDNGTFRLSSSAVLLAELFADAGYRTGAFVGAFALDSRFQLDQGFEIYDDDLGRRPDGRPASERRAEDVVRSVLSWLDTLEESEPFFAFVHVFDPHSPYRAPAPFHERFAETPYDGEVAYVDHVLRNLLASLRGGGRLEDTVVVVTADHGEGLGDHGERTHGMFAYESTIRVPLIWAGPGVPENRRVSSRARLVDVAPTLLELTGLTAPGGLDGASLVPAMKGTVAEAERDRDSYFEALAFHFNRGGAPLIGLYRGEHKYISLPIPELYDLGDDPGEERNLARRDPALTERLDAELSRLVAARTATGPLPAVGASSEVIERLSSLGYLTSIGSAAPRAYSAADDPKRLLAVADKLDDAIQAYQQDEPDPAIRLLREVLVERPGVATAYVYLAYVLRDQDRLDEAVAVLEAALQRGVDTPPLRGLLGGYLQRLGRLEESVAVLEPLVREHPEAIEEREGLGLSYAMMGRVEDAREMFESILEVAPDHEPARLHLGQAHFELGGLDEAERAFRHVIERGDRMRAMAWAGLGSVHYARERRSEAIDAWRRAFELGYDDPDTTFRLGVVLRETQRIGEAIATFRRYLDATRDDPDRATERAAAQRFMEENREQPVALTP